MFKTIRWNGFETNILGIIFYSVIAITAIICMVCAIVRRIKYEIDRNKREKHLQRTKGKRMFCNECSYCKEKLHKPFRNSMELSSFYPYYCKKFRIYLPVGNPFTRCRAEDPDDARRDGIPSP